MLDDARVERAGEIGMLVCYDARLIANGIEYILKPALAEKLVSGAERNLNDAAELGELLGRVVLDVGDALRVKCVRRPVGAISRTNHSRTSKYATSCLTMAFHATKRSMRTSDGRRSLPCVLFWIKLRLRLTPVAPLRRETEVAREMDAVSL
jgi:hypothetical protein